MWSFARTPGNRFVIDRSSRTGASAFICGDSTTADEGAGPRACPFAETSFPSLLGGRNDLAAGDQLLDVVHLLDDRSAVLHLGADLAVADAVVLEAEDLVIAGAKLGRILLEVF